MTLFSERFCNFAHMDTKDLKSRSFWNRPPLERSQIAAERLRRRMAQFNVTQDQVARYTRMDLPRLQAILGGTVVMELYQIHS